MSGAETGLQSYLGDRTSSNASPNPSARAVGTSGTSGRPGRGPSRAQVSDRSGISVAAAGDWASRRAGRYQAADANRRIAPTTAPNAPHGKPFLLVHLMSTSHPSWRSYDREPAGVYGASHPNGAPQRPVPQDGQIFTNPRSGSPGAPRALIETPRDQAVMRCAAPVGVTYCVEASAAASYAILPPTIVSTDSISLISSAGTVR